MIDTPGLNGLAQSQEQIEQFKTSFVSTVPLGRMGSVLMKSRKQFRFWHRMTAVMLRELNCS
jgi:hypothetical protein